MTSFAKERLFLGISLLLALLAFLAPSTSLSFRYAVAFPMGAWGLGFVNTLLRSKVLAWGIFTLAFVFFMIVMGAFTVRYQSSAHADTLMFLRAMGMYLSLCVAALFQLQFRRRVSSGGTHV